MQYSLAFWRYNQFISVLRKNDNIEIIDTKNNIIKNMKINIIHDEGLPNVLCEYMKSVRSMEFEEKPNYSILEDMFKREINVL